MNLSWIMGLLYLAIVLPVLYQLLTGRIRTAGMLSAESADSSEVPFAFTEASVVSAARRNASPERIQLLASSAFAVGAYALQFVDAHQAALATRTLPNPSPAVLAAFGGSHVVYLGIKATRKFRGGSRP